MSRQVDSFPSSFTVLFPHEKRVHHARHIRHINTRHIVATSSPLRLLRDIADIHYYEVAESVITFVSHTMLLFTATTDR
jgi:hypothetical protein